MTFHYIRKNDASGTIQRVNGMGVGLALQKVIASNRTLPLATSVEVLRFAADILNEAMKSRVIHGDIKIENLAVMNDGSLIINGFDRPRRNSITPEGMISHEGDIYGLGLVMLEMLSGQRNIELPLDEGLHNQKVLQAFLTIDWQEWTQQPWLSTMQEYLISLLFYDKTQRPHPLDIANILKEASQTTASLGIQQYMQHKGLHVSMEQESLEMARTLRSSTLISTVEVTADSEGTATGFFTRDKIAEMFQEPVPEERARRTEWSPELSSSSPKQPKHDQGGNEASLDLSPQEVAQISTDPPAAPEPPAWSTPAPPTPPSQTQNTQWQAPNQPNWSTQTATPPPVPPIPKTRPVQSPPVPTPPVPPVQPTAASGWTNSAATELPTSTNPAPPPWQTPSTTPPAPPRTPSIQEQPTPSLPPPIASSSPQNTVPPLPVPTPPPPTVQTGSAPEQPAWSNPTPPPQPNFAIGAGHQSVAPPPTPNSNRGGMNKWVLIGGAGVGLLLIVVAVLLWQLLSGEEESNSSEIVVETIDDQTPEPQDVEPEDIEEADPVQEEIEEPKATKPKPKPKAKVKQSKPASKSTRKTSSKKTSKPKKSTTKSTPAPTTVGVGEFSVTISFQKEATLECGDGQTKDFVRQTTMTFKTPTACRISTEDGERGALTARKSGTMTCTLAGSRIRCK